MKKALIVFITLLSVSISFGEGLGSLVGKSFKLDKEATQSHLKENGIFPEELLPKLDEFMEHLVVEWKKESIITQTWEGTGSSEYRLVAETKKKIILQVKNELGEWNETRIILTPDGYWQETDAFEGYREKFTLYTPPLNESNQSR